MAAYIGLMVYYFPEIDVFARMADPSGTDPVSAVITKIVPGIPFGDPGGPLPQTVNLTIFPDQQKPENRTGIVWEPDKTAGFPYYDFIPPPTP